MLVSLKIMLELLNRDNFATIIKFVIKQNNFLDSIDFLQSLNFMNENIVVALIRGISHVKIGRIWIVFSLIISLIILQHNIMYYSRLSEVTSYNFFLLFSVVIIVRDY